MPWHFWAGDKAHTDAPLVVFPRKKQQGSVCRKRQQVSDHSNTKYDLWLTVLCGYVFQLQDIRLNIVDQFLAPETGNLFQFLKYAISGCIAVSVHILIFHVVAWKVFFALQADDWFARLLNLPMYELDDATRSRNSMKANAIAFVISNLVAYLINIYWVFVPGRYHWIIEIALFYLVSGVAIVIGTAVMGLLIRRFGILTTYAFGANIFSAFMINYGMRKFFIFKG
jgi:putative flippase GtrA